MRPSPLLLGGGGLRPRLGRLDLAEAEALLQGLAGVNRVQLLRGVPGVSTALQLGRLRYIRSDPSEHWRSVREIWANGGGDCEDLAAAVAAELQLRGIQARPVVRRVSPTLAHALVAVRHHNGGETLIDPSITGGMRGP